MKLFFICSLAFQVLFAFEFSPFEDQNETGLFFEPGDELDIRDESQIATSDSEESLECGTTVQVYNGESYRFKNYRKSCYWAFEMQPKVKAEMQCLYLYAPCSYGKSLTFNFAFGGSIWKPDFCSSFLLKNVKSTLGMLPKGYRLSVTSTSQALVDCVVIGNGGEVRPENSTSTTSSPSNPLPSQEKCGRNAKSRIIDGSEAQPHEYPWAAALILGSRSFCGGTLISDRWILTAAHCTEDFKPEDITVGLGCHGLDSSCTFLTVDTVVNHPQYESPRRLANDISLIRLSDQIDLDRVSNRIYPACFPTERTPTPSHVLKVIGWGQTRDGQLSYDTLKEADIITRSDEQCKFWDTLICASKLSGSYCFGDSGSFVGTKRQDQYQVDGVVSFISGRNGCIDALMGITEVYSYLDWIIEIIQNTM